MSCSSALTIACDVGGAFISLSRATKFIVALKAHCP